MAKAIKKKAAKKAANLTQQGSKNVTPSVNVQSNVQLTESLANDGLSASGPGDKVIEAVGIVNEVIDLVNKIFKRKRKLDPSVIRQVTNHLMVNVYPNIAVLTGLWNDSEKIHDKFSDAQNASAKEFIVSPNPRAVGYIVTLADYTRHASKAILALEDAWKMMLYLSGNHIRTISDAAITKSPVALSDHAQIMLDAYLTNGKIDIAPLILSALQPRIYWDIDLIDG